MPWEPSSSRLRRIGTDHLGDVGNGKRMRRARCAEQQLLCTGDCNYDRMVTIGELLLGVNLALGADTPHTCPMFDCRQTGTVPIDCLIRALNAALTGCPGV